MFIARISKISDQAEFTPKNVETAEERLKLVFGVELAFVNPDGALKPGMPADGVIHWTAEPSGGRGAPWIVTRARSWKSAICGAGTAASRRVDAVRGVSFAVATRRDLRADRT